MKKLFSFLFVLIAAKGQAQNLVPNGSFENYSSCPNTPSQIYKAIGWFQPNKYPGGYSVNQSSSSDYFNSCADSVIDIPTNSGGFQYAKSGDAYIGLTYYSYFYNGNGGREYAEVKLTKSLSFGEKYRLKYYVSMANGSRFSITKFDAHFSTDSLLDSASFDLLTIPVTPQIQYNGRIDDTLNWVEVNGSFIASGGERFLTLGNFHDGSLCDSMRTSIVSINNCCYGYYYIDDVSLVEDSTIGIEEFAQIEVSVFPIPAKSNVQLSAQQVFKEITVMDMRGKMVLQQKPFKMTTLLDISHWDDGVYFVKCKLKNEQVVHKKIVVQH
ncbi:MAG TPA: T9SS type A sorting domain-containing protein [Bacteroidia bacterium]|nr:T9SS type A sorting domain-containing protein [Bacteroidia bacterium]